MSFSDADLIEMFDDWARWDADIRRLYDMIEVVEQFGYLAVLLIVILLLVSIGTCLHDQRVRRNEKVD